MIIRLNKPFVPYYLTNFLSLIFESDHSGKTQKHNFLVS